jgi:probable phosphoglycerate mutase
MHPDALLLGNDALSPHGGSLAYQNRHQIDRAQSTLVIFARHGETALNAARRFRGRANPPLTEEGERQARMLAEALGEHALSALYTSPRDRTRSTAEAIRASTGIVPMVAAALDDLDYGAWSGKTDEEVQREWPELYQRWRQNPELIAFPDGEGVPQVLWRVATFFRFVREDHAGETIVAVTHDAIIRSAVCAALEIPMERFHRISVGLASTTGLFIGKGPTRLAWLNETTHLRARRRLLTEGEWNR